jgi:hypothetical protein
LNPTGFLSFFTVLQRGNLRESGHLTLRFPGIRKMRAASFSGILVHTVRTRATDTAMHRSELFKAGEKSPPDVRSLSLTPNPT